MNNIVKRYFPAAIAAAAFAVFIIAFPAYREKAFGNLAFQTNTMLLVLPPIFLLLGLLDIWVPREKMVRFLGSGSGMKGRVLAFLLGSFAAGPLYGAFPFAAVLMKKGADFSNVLIFVGAWSTTKIPMLLFEMSALGRRFALSRLAVDIIGILIIARIIRTALPRKEIERLYAEAGRID